jgi:tape measure domain-containing protein
MAGFTGALGSLWVEIGARISGFESAMADVSNRIDTGISEINNKISSVDFTAMGESMTRAGAALTAGVTAPIIGIGAASVSAAAQMDSLVRGLTAVTGSSEAANTQLERLKEVAKLPGLGFEEAIQGSINLQAAGFSATEAENALKGFGNALATVGKGKADLDGVILALGQIASKGKISAEEINQLAERVPQIRQIMQQAFGTADTEVLQKAGIGAQQFVNAVTTELLKLPPVTGGLRNDFENLSDRFNQTMAAIGTNMQPAITSAVTLLSTLLEKLQGVAEWFGTLPTPVQNAALALGAIAAAAGPLLLLFGQLATAIGAIGALFAEGGLLAGIGVTAAGFSAVALAIPLVTAALVALGTWVYANWEPIKATVFQAWEGLSELWHGIWDPIAGWLTVVWDGIATAAAPVWDPISNFFHTIWDGVAPYFSSAWEGIKTALGSVWGAIKSTASTIWGGIVSVFETFLEWAAKIPGANKLMNLDDAWNSAKKAGEELKKTSDATEDFSKKANAAGGSASKPIPKLAGAIKSVGKAAKDADDDMKPLIRSNPVLNEMVKQLEGSHRKWASEMAAAKIALMNLKDGMPPMLQASDELKASIDNVTTAMGNAKIAAPPFGAEIAAAIGMALPEPPKLTAAFNDSLGNMKGALGTHKTDQANTWGQVKTDAENALGAIPGKWSGILSGIHSDTKNTSTGLPGLKGLWDTFSTDVSGVISGLTKDIGGKLFTGDLSFIQNGIKGLKDLGKSFLDDFVSLATRTGQELLNGVISDLIGGKGFGGIADSIKNAGNVFKDVFGGASSNVPGVPSGGGGGGSIPTGGGGSGSGGGIGGVAGAVNLVSGIVSAVAGVVTAIGTVRLEGTMNAVEHNTRYAMMYLGERSDGGILGVMFRVGEYLQYVQPLLDGVNAKLNDWLEPLTGQLAHVVEAIPQLQRRLDEISHNTLWGSASDRDNTTLLTAMRDLLGTNRQPTITVTINGVSVPSTAIQLRTQGLI